MAWPPTLDELKVDMKIDLIDTRDDERLTQALDAAVWFVQRVRPEFRYDVTNAAQFELPDTEKEKDLRLGTIRLAARWHLRRRSPDGLIAMAELGVSRVTSFDPDIDRQLRIGRHQKMRVG